MKHIDTKKINSQNEAYRSKKINSQNEAYRSKKINSQNEAYRSKKINSQNEAYRSKKINSQNEIYRKGNVEKQLIDLQLSNSVLDLTSLATYTEQIIPWKYNPPGLYRMVLIILIGMADYVSSVWRGR